ncbi:MAG TPA: malto-oligosyltrehalose synthase [Verrucomicrobiae bacterium]|nr:malto-oligosyltrehalose synthase [Verrucomicrobiae bacterium]
MSTEASNSGSVDSFARVPRATYRLQFNHEFTLRQAIELVPYLNDLGISHLYASPLLKACPESMHGYDVCDYSQLNPELGTEVELEELVAHLRKHDMGLVLDIVPNHMGISSRENRWWWDVLKNGRASRFADFFDIDWESPDPRLRGKVLVPVLGDFYGRILQRGELKLAYEQGEIVLCYYDHRFPISSETLTVAPASLAESLAKLNGDLTALDELIQKQHYRLAGWRHGNAELNYRRFFDISTLAGIRVEDPRVFGAVHALGLRWYANGWIDGFRVDHPDGLHDPTEYFERLRVAAPCAWIVAEKILQPGEVMPEDWPVAGTTGYEFMRRVTGLFIDPESEKPLTDVYVEFTGEPTDYGFVVREKQKLVLRGLLEAEVNWLTRLLVRIAGRYWRYRDLAETDLRETLIEVTARLPVYCTYVQAHLGRVPDADAAVISETISWARQRRSNLPPEGFDFIEDLLLLRLSGEVEHEFVMRFQQLTGPTMAKGAEDTACYCFNRLIALNIVSGDPGRFGLTPQSFHERCARARRRWPHSMLTTSTHDTKRSGDVRMRICLLSEIPQEWRTAVVRWSTMNEKHRRGEWPDRNIEYFYYQTLVGAWPLPLERALLVMEKAAREAKQYTSWTRPNSGYDSALREFVKGTLGDQQFIADLERFMAKLVEPGQVNSLAELLLKLTTPGVPDIYQGDELWDFSLVDPDNRRSIDFAMRRRLLAELSGLSVDQVWRRRNEGLPKIWLLQKTLHFRRDHPELLGGESSYEPCSATGAKAEHVVAFIRSARVATIVPRLVVRLKGEWNDTRLSLPAGNWTNELTGEAVAGGVCHLADLLKHFPVALLSRKERD